MYSLLLYIIYIRVMLFIFIFLYSITSLSLSYFLWDTKSHSPALTMSAFCVCVCVKEREMSGTSSSSSSSRSMEYWLNKMRRVCVAVFSRIKHPKSLSPGGSGGISDDFGSVGLMKLQDVVETCGYHDVHVMWNLMINKADGDGDGDIDGDGHDHDQRPCSILGLEEAM